MVKEIYSRTWDFTLYETETGYVLSVIFFGLVDYFRSFELHENELTQDFEELKLLSETIRNNYDNYKDREITPAITVECS